MTPSPTRGLTVEMLCILIPPFTIFLCSWPMLLMALLRSATRGWETYHVDRCIGAHSVAITWCRHKWIINQDVTDCRLMDQLSSSSTLLLQRYQITTTKKKERRKTTGSLIVKRGAPSNCRNRRNGGVNMLTLDPVNEHLITSSSQLDQMKQSVLNRSVLTTLTFIYTIIWLYNSIFVMIHLHSYSYAVDQSHLINYIKKLVVLIHLHV